MSSRSENSRVELGIDLETCSDISIQKCGSYRYCASPYFDILLATYKFSDEDEYHTIDFYYDDPMDSRYKMFWDALRDDGILKAAWNVAFERVALTKWLYCNCPSLLQTPYCKGEFSEDGLPTDPVFEHYLLPIHQWSDTMILASRCGLPRSLDAAGKVLFPGEEDKQKIAAGRRLIRLFCVPQRKKKGDISAEPQFCDPRADNGKKQEEIISKWKQFKEYNRQDVVTEQAIRNEVKKIYVPNTRERQLWYIDQNINDNGVLLDTELAQNIVNYDRKRKERLTAEAKLLTGLENPNSTQQLIGWLKEKGLDLTNPDTGKDTIDKAKVKELLSDTALDPEVRQVLTIRQDLNKTSVKKFQTMLDIADPVDHRARGILSFYGAVRTGRWAGKFLQPQNLSKNHMSDEDLDQVRKMAEENRFDEFETYCSEHKLGNPGDVLSQLVRTGFIPSEGHRFIVTDFSAIEARVIAWLAGEQWRLDTFRNGGDIYCESASQMFGVPVEKNGVNGELRAQGKVAELACIAAGSLVKTKRGLVPIEEIRHSDKIWDGKEYVSHGGVMYRGNKPVITYDNLSATWDHRVYCYGRKKPVSLFFAGTKHLKLRRGKKGEECPETIPLTGRTVPVFDIVNCGPRHRYCVQNRIVHNCGYGGGRAAMKRMDFAHAIDDDQKYDDIVKKWRKRSPAICSLWYDYEKTARKMASCPPDTIEKASGQIVPGKNAAYTEDVFQNVVYEKRSGGSETTAVKKTYHKVPIRMETVRTTDLKPNVELLHIYLPSGRDICYWGIREMPVSRDARGRSTLTFQAQNQTTKKWEDTDTYGGKLTENIVQATARDVLAEKMIKMMTRYRYQVVFHIHDEMILDIPKEDLKTAETIITEIMAEELPWAKGLPLASEPYVCEYYRKE